MGNSGGTVLLTLASHCLPNLPGSFLHDLLYLISSSSCRRSAARPPRYRSLSSQRPPLLPDLCRTPPPVRPLMFAARRFTPQRRHLAAIPASLPTTAVGLSILPRVWLPSASPSSVTPTLRHQGTLI
ncbi:hypothetical protein ZWY2020_012168 [Hordeum vulgare]|nr:hypothetical protein ZWY2020_012168 [Hordeum vulgare]